MSDYRRCFVSGGTYFFTLVTFERRPLFADALARRCLREVMVFVQQRNSFSMPGICLLPDHLHCIWTLPAGDEDFSLRWNMVKGLFSKRFRTRGGQVGMVG
ncbi:MAG: transposase, partial [Candidatus Thiodiazotropha sp. 6PLUC5]